MKYLVQPLVSNSANAPGQDGAEGRVFTIASEQSGMVLAVRDELAWQQVPGGLKHVSAGVDGTVWGVNAADQIWQWTGGGWQQMPGALKQISVGSASQIWGVNSNDDIWRWTGGGWAQVGGKLKHVSVGADGTVWGVNSADDIFRMTPSGWVHVAGKLKQISVGNRTTVWGVSSIDEIFVRQGDHWQKIDGKLKHVSVAADGAVWGVSSNDEIWRWRGGGWEKMPGALKQVSPGSASNVWGVNAADQIWRNAGAGHGRVVQQIWTEDPRQQWRFTPNGDGTFRIDNVATGHSLDVRGGSTDKGADILCWPWHGGPNQRWKVSDLGVARFRVDSLKSGLSLDVTGGSYEAGAMIIQWPWHGGGNQRWRLSEVRPASVIFDAAATIYEHANFQGASARLGPGAYDINALGGVGNDRASSVRVPAGLRVTLFEHAGFSGRRKVFTGDTAYVGNDFNDIASGVLVEKVVRIYEHANYQGREAILGTGKINMGEIGLANDTLSSLRVPQGMVVTLYEHANFQGAQRVYFEDSAFVGGAFNDKVSSIEIQQLGVVIPRNAIRFGGKINLRGHHGKWLVAEDNGALNANRPHAQTWETFTVERAGPSQHTSHLAFGDVIALRSFHGKYVVAEENGAANANRGAIGPWEKWVVVRAGASASDVFVSHGDVIALRSWQKRHLVAEADGNANANRDKIGDWERWLITGYTAPNQSSDTGGGICGAAVCGANVCAAEACGADACGAEACGVDAALVGVCGVAAAGIAICGADVAVISICGAAACGADACGAAACGAEACGAAACGADVNPIDACGAQAGSISVCPADVCGANACAINACPADACAADACAIDVVPIIPGI